ncbi:MAG: hypothetical protein Q4F95_07285 [Oscillospiraceae bacterium]|nr:hypothetical protein [Oscillospiraceae bacterium]
MSINKMIRQKVIKIMGLAMQISPPDRDRETGEPDVFVIYEAHVSWLEVRYYAHGFGDGSDCTWWSTIWLTSGNTIRKLNEAIKYLEKIKEDLHNEQ